MKKIFTNSFLFVLASQILAFASAGCKVEVGNPHGDDEGKPPSVTGNSNPGTGASANLTLDVGNISPAGSYSKVYLNIKKIYLVTQGLKGISLTMTDAAAKPVEFASLANGGLLQTLVLAQSIPQDKYLGFVLELDKDKPGWVIDSEGVEKPIVTSKPDSNFVIISYTIDWASDDKVILFIDLFSSIKKQDQPTYLLDPVFYPVKQSQMRSLKGKMSRYNSGMMCLFSEKAADAGASLSKSSGTSAVQGGTDAGGRMKLLNSENSSRQKNESDDHGYFMQNQDMPPDNMCVKARVRGSEKRSPIQDQGVKGASLGDCMLITPVDKDGTFSFRFLDAGDYSLRYFTNDGKAYDIKGSVTVSNAEETNIGEVAIDSRQ
ncbi:MAG: hypothetical protein HQK54_10345 [Oligoflexales bacterium]|nr:hypothetical protein [Oligoflexales bacterium]